MDYKIQWKESVGGRQYGLSTPDGINMVMLMTDDAFNTEEDMAVEVIDGRNAYNAAKRQAILDAVHLHFPELSSYIETSYLSSSPLWFFMDDNTLAIIWSSEGVQHGAPYPLFCFL